MEKYLYEFSITILPLMRGTWTPFLETCHLNDVEENSAKRVCRFYEKTHEKTREKKPNKKKLVRQMIIVYNIVIINTNDTFRPF